MFSSIRTKLTTTYVVLLVVVMVSASFFLLNLLKNYYFAYQHENLVSAAKVVRDLVAPKLQAVPDVVDISNQAELVARQSRSRILITDDRQRVLGDSVRVEGLVGTVLNRPEITHALLNQNDKSWSVQYSEASGVLVLQVAVPIEVDGKILGAVFVSSSLQEIDKMQKDIRNYLLLITLLAILAAGVIGRFLTNKITGPIQSLSEATEKMAKGDLSQRVPVRSRDEIGRLTKLFNEMAAQLQENTRKLKEFVADASHEMRTPLTSLNILVKSMRDFPLEPEEREEFLDDIDQELERLIRLVENLLDLTRLDKLATEETMTVADVVPTIRQTLEM
ncbi:MAG: cell wall metabolism sensor histidine kinase WalK, partial [Firmicutes bacterium]|nr:cell wall metabolism sensor histidine kinase WalK [Bacillota bacterium]